MLGARVTGAGRAWGAAGSMGAGRHDAGAGARHGARAAGARAAGSGERGLHSRGAADARPGHWARGLALGCALGALGPFSIRFDSVFFLSQLLDIVREPGS